MNGPARSTLSSRSVTCCSSLSILPKSSGPVGTISAPWSPALSWHPSRSRSMPDPTVPQSLTEGAAERQMARLTRRSFVTGAVAGLAGFGAWHWLRTAGPEDGLPWPLRRVLGFNRAVAESLGAPHRLAPTFPADSARGLARTNGLVGLED